MSKFKVGDIVACVTSDEWNGSVGEVVSEDESGSVGVELGDGSVYPFDTFELEIIS